MPKDNRRERTKEALRDAMISLLKRKSFDQITTTELVATAQISRSSFYTHYSDKYDMIDHYQQALFNTIEYIFDKSKGDLHATLLETFEFLEANDIYAALLSENSSKEIHVFFQSKVKNLLENRFYPLAGARWQKFGKLGEIYDSTYYAHGIFGLTQVWLFRGKKESPAQMAELLVHLIGASTDE
jgi:AcrR family transcriptional regulator